MRQAPPRCMRFEDSLTASLYLTRLRAFPLVCDFSPAYDDLPVFVKPALAAKAGKEYSVSWEPVYRLVKQIPRGRVLTYGHVARMVRLRGGARTAGFAMAATPSGRGIPWHRVVGARGRLLVQEPYASKQRMLLESEGVAVNGTRIDLARHLWTPRKRQGRARPGAKAKKAPQRA
jgi:methylated-DNA-protein-cysteine methyltransferase-like protein